jgi:hypothetical protein
MRETHNDSSLLDELSQLLVPGISRVAHHYVAATEPSGAGPDAAAEVRSSPSS